MKIHLKNHTKC